MQNIRLLPGELGGPLINNMFLSCYCGKNRAAERNVLAQRVFDPRERGGWDRSGRHLVSGVAEPQEQCLQGWEQPECAERLWALVLLCWGSNRLTLVFTKLQKHQQHQAHG